MSEWQAIAVFCEDIREEKNGQDTLIGVFPDNINLPSVPAALPKLGVYVRIVFPVDSEIKKITGTLRLLDGQNINLANFDEKFIREQKEICRRQSNPIVALISKALASPFNIQKVGRMVLNVKGDDEERLCGTLNVEIVPTPAAPTS